MLEWKVMLDPTELPVQSSAGTIYSAIPGLVEHRLNVPVDVPQGKLSLMMSLKAAIPR